MSEVFVPFEGKARDKAVLLLAAAEEKGEPGSVVRSTEGGFYAPQEIVNAAGLGESGDTSSEEEAPKRTTKKAAAKKSTRKQSKE
jgi:hypothetical protein